MVETIQTLGREGADIVINNVAHVTTLKIIDIIGTPAFRK